jgi:proteasome lid subunit RPN8/RPN11
VLIEQALLDEVIAHAREEYDAECCGVVAVAPGPPPRRAVRVHRAVNVFDTHLKFEIDGKELLKLLDAIEDDGLELGAIYHSHTRTEPKPSQTDIGFAANWPGLEWVIVGLAGERPEVRSYLIDAGDVREVELRAP